MLVLLPTAGAKRTETNPFGWRLDLDPIERVRTALAAGATEIGWHELRTTWKPHGQQGAHLVLGAADLDRFKEANQLAHFHGAVTWAYVSSEVLTGNAESPWRAADIARSDDALLFMAEAEAYRRIGIDGMIYDRGAVPANWRFMQRVASGICRAFGMRFMVEAVPRQPKPNRHIPTWRWPCAMLDQFAAKNWEKLRIAEWGPAPNLESFHCIERDASSGGMRLTEEQWAILTQNGWQRGVALGPGVELSE